MKARSILAITLIVIGGYLASSGGFSLDPSLNLNKASTGLPGAVFWKTDKPLETVERPRSFADLAQNLSPTVVNIQTERTAGSRFGSPEDLFEEFFGRRPHVEKPRKKHPRFRTESTGSGFIISEDGYIVTNNHVVENADKIMVVFDDGQKLEAKSVGLDKKTDLALIKVESQKKLPVAPLGDSKQLRVGDWVMAIGNPFGLDHSVTVGILSAKGRNINAGPYDDFLQTDASINPGNSGGPLIDMTGRVIGINTAINAAGQGIGFAIPINMAKELLPQLRESGSVTRGWLGVQIQRITPALAKSFGLDAPRGALVSQVFDDSPAAKAKIERGDVIIQFNGTDIKNYDDLPRRVASTPPGSSVDVIVMREGKRKTLHTVLEKMEPAEDVALTSDETEGTDWGFKARNLTPEVAQQLGLSEEERGVVVAEVEAGGSAARAGMRRGDLILEANREKIESVGDLEEALGKDDDRLVLLVQRGKSTIYLAIEQE